MCPRPLGSYKYKGAHVAARACVRARACRCKVDRGHVDTVRTQTNGNKRKRRLSASTLSLLQHSPKVVQNIVNGARTHNPSTENSYSIPTVPPFVSVSVRKGKGRTRSERLHVTRPNKSLKKYTVGQTLDRPSCLRVDFLKTFKTEFQDETVENNDVDKIRVRRTPV